MKNKEQIFVFDTSALVKISQTDIIFHSILYKQMRELTIYIPEIVKEEYIMLGCNAFDSTKLEVNSMPFLNIDAIINSMKKFSDISNYYGLKTDHVDKNIEILKNINITAMTKEFKEFSKKHKEERIEYFSEFPYDFPLIPFSITERYSELVNAKIRFENNIPPGYKDKKNKTKSELDKYNDYFIWKSLLHFFKEKSGSIVFVTNDLKDTSKSYDKNLLIREFYENTQLNLELISSDEFIMRIDLEGMSREAEEEHLEQQLVEWCNNEMESLLENVDYSEIIYSYVDYSGCMEESVESIGIGDCVMEYVITSFNTRRISLSVDIGISFSFCTDYGESGYGEIQGIFLCEFEHNISKDSTIELDSEFITLEVPYENNW